MPTDDEPTPALTYATPSAGAGSPVAAGVVVVLGGLTLVFFGGCFCIGLLALATPNVFSGGPPPPGAMSTVQGLLLAVLFACALACLVGGGYTFVLGVRRLPGR